MTIYLNGKIVKEVPTHAKLVRKVEEVYYETEDYSKQQNINAMNYFAKQRELREELEQRHG